MNTKTNANSVEWRIDEEYYPSQDEYRAIIDDGGKVIVHVLNENFYEDITNQEAEANAKLIAISPIMFSYIQKAAESGCLEAKEIIERAT